MIIIIIYFYNYYYYYAHLYSFCASWLHSHSGNTFTSLLTHSTQWRFYSPVHIKVHIIPSQSLFLGRTDESFSAGFQVSSFLAIYMFRWWHHPFLPAASETCTFFSPNDFTSSTASFLNFSGFTVFHSRCFHCLHQLPSITVPNVPLTVLFARDAPFATY